jgi:hypothetical protein
LSGGSRIKLLDPPGSPQLRLPDLPAAISIAVVGGTMNNNNNNKPLDLTKPVQTRDGQPARIICTDRQGFFSVVALVGKHDDLRTFTPGGTHYGSTPSPFDLINTPEKVEVKGWVNVYRAASSGCLYLGGAVYATRETAAASALTGAIASISIHLLATSGTVCSGHRAHQP